MRITEYKIVETQTVTDEELERIINTWVRRGWVYDGVQFAMRESSKRPSMAFVTFTRSVEAPPEGEGDEGEGADADAAPLLRSVDSEPEADEPEPDEPPE